MAVLTTNAGYTEAAAYFADPANVEAPAEEHNEYPQGINSFIIKKAKDLSDAATLLAAQVNAGTVSKIVTAAGATPVDTDVTAWANNTLGIVIGTGGRVFAAFKNSTDVYYVELTALA